MMTKPFVVLLLLLTQSLPASPAEPRRTTVDSDGTVHIPAFAVPLSRYMSEQAKQMFIDEALKPKATKANSSDGIPPIAKLRAKVDDWIRPMVEKAKILYPVNIEERKIGGVRTIVVTPKAGVSAKNSKRVLINLHGGGFRVGAGLHGEAESIPVACVAQIRVITVDYRMAPEYSFPAASEDVASVYAELLKEYRAEDIGIYGCSAGGVLTSMAVAWLQKEKLPRPGAICMFSAGAFGSFSGPPGDPNTWGGDSRYFAPPLVGESPLPLHSVSAVAGAMDYIGNTDPKDPLVSPALSSTILAKFPPTLLLTGTRAYDMSAVVQTQRELTKAGVEANLHLWDGLGHAFYLFPELPESKEAYAVIADFFNSHLGISPPARIAP